METRTVPSFFARAFEKLKAVPKRIYISFALLIALAVAGAAAACRYEAPVQERTLEYWTHNFISAFEDLAVGDGEVLQEFTAGEKNLTEFILLFDNFAPEDTASICVTLENKAGKEFYRWEVPVAALTGETFYLCATVDQPLQKGQPHYIRIGLSGGDSGITVRTLLKNDYKEEELHPSVGQLTANGQAKESLLYFSQKYQVTVSYARIWNGAVLITLLLLLVLVWCRGSVLSVIWEGVNVVLLLAVSYCSIELLSGNIYTVEGKYAILTALLLVSIYLALRAVGGRAAFYITAVLTLLAGVTNFYVLQFKGAEFLLTDISAFSTAMSVADNYVFTFPPVLFAAGMLYGCVIVLQIAIDGSFAAGYQKPKLVKRAVLLAIAVAAFFSVTVGAKKAAFNYFELDANFSQYGWWYSNVCVVQNSSMKKPADYSAKTVQQLLADVKMPQKQEITPKNLIVIMNEAWSDLSVAGALETNEDYMPFVRSLTENTVKGYVHIPTFGGGTCYTEYEFLTGNSLRFMPNGSTPYAKGSRLKDEPSIASILKEQGYRTVAMHPYGPTNWNRDDVYPAMGFDEFISIDDYEDSELIRNYVSDKSDYDKIIEYYEANQGEKLFVFNVTMQNHGGYDAGNGKMETPVQAENIDSDEADVFLSLMKETDEAFEYLLSYFSEVSEPTMIVMFGDHLPALQESFYDALYGKEESQRTEQEKNTRFVTPYVIWTNYPSAFAEVPETSVNYLGSMVLEYAGAQMPLYNRFLLEKQKEIPVIGLLGIYDAEGNFTPHKDVAEELLQDYKILQYLRVEDRKSELYNIFKVQE